MIEKEDEPTKYINKNYARLLVVKLIFLIFVGFKLYSFFNNFFFSTINLGCSFSGNVVKFPCSEKLRKLLSYHKCAKNIEEFIKSFSLCLKAQCFQSLLKWISTLIRDGIFFELFFNLIYYSLFYSFLDDASIAFLSYFVTILYYSSV